MHTPANPYIRKWTNNDSAIKTLFICKCGLKRSWWENNYVQIIWYVEIAKKLRNNWCLHIICTSICMRVLVWQQLQAIAHSAFYVYPRTFKYNWCFRNTLYFCWYIHILSTCHTKQIRVFSSMHYNSMIWKN